MNPKVSVIITTYNQVHSIAEALDSVLGQKCDFDYEIILGDDGSTDGTREVCEEYARRFPDIIRLMPRVPNKGMVDNFFDCMESTRGEYVTDCAGDDSWISPVKLDIMARRLDEWPGATVVFSDWEVHDVATGHSYLASSRGNNLVGVPGLIPGREILRLTLNHVNSLPYNLSASMYRRSAVMDALRNDREMVRNVEFGCEDVPLMAALAVRGGAISIDEPTLRYNVVDDSISNSSDIGKQVRFYCKSLHCSAVLGARYDVPQPCMARVFRSKSDYLLAMAFNSGSTHLRDTVTAVLSEWMLPLSLKSRAHLAAMQNGRIWRLARNVKRLIR